MRYANLPSNRLRAITEFSPEKNSRASSYPRREDLCPFLDVHKKVGRLEEVRERKRSNVHIDLVALVRSPEASIKGGDGGRRKKSHHRPRAEAISFRWFIVDASMKRPQCRIVGSDRTSVVDAQPARCDPANCAGEGLRAWSCATPPPPTVYITVRYALFALATHRTDVFRGTCRERKKVDAAAAPNGQRVRIRCAANRTTSGYTLTFLWPLPPRSRAREALRASRAYIRVDSSCKSRVPVAFFIFAPWGRAHASRRFSRMREQICGRNTCIVH